MGQFLGQEIVYYGRVELYDISLPFPIGLKSGLEANQNICLNFISKSFAPSDDFDQVRILFRYMPIYVSIIEIPKKSLESETESKRVVPKDEGVDHVGNKNSSPDARFCIVDKEDRIDSCHESEV